MINDLPEELRKRIESLVRKASTENPMPEKVVHMVVGVCMLMYQMGWSDCCTSTIKMLNVQEKAFTGKDFQDIFDENEKNNK